MKNEKLLLNLSGIDFFFIERIRSKTFPKKTIGILSIPLHYLKDMLDK